MIRDGRRVVGRVVLVDGESTGILRTTGAVIIDGFEA